LTRIAAADACDLSSADLAAARSRFHRKFFIGWKRTHATGGLILLDRHGNPGFAFNTPRMAYGLTRWPRDRQLQSSGRSLAPSAFEIWFNQ